MKINHYVTCVAMTFLLFTNCFSANQADEHIEYSAAFVAQQHLERKNDFNDKPSVTSQDSPKTAAINTVLSNESKVDTRHANDIEIQQIIKAVMGNAVVHHGDMSKEDLSAYCKFDKRQSLNQNDFRYWHFEILRQTLELSYELVTTIRSHGLDLIDDILGQYNASEYNDIFEHSVIDRTLFLGWFREVFVDHTVGFNIVDFNKVAQQEERDRLFALSIQEEFDRADAETDRLFAEALEATLNQNNIIYIGHNPHMGHNDIQFLQNHGLPPNQFQQQNGDLLENVYSNAEQAFIDEAMNPQGGMQNKSVKQLKSATPVQDNVPGFPPQTIGSLMTYLFTEFPDEYKDCKQKLWRITNYGEFIVRISGIQDLNLMEGMITPVIKKDESEKKETAIFSIQIDEDEITKTKIVQLTLERDL